MRRLRWELFLAGLLMAGSAGITEPDLARPQPAGPLRVYPDTAHPSLFYLAPGELTLGLQDDGTPDLHLLAVRYQGHAAAGNRGERVVRSLLSFRVELAGPDAGALAAARRALQAQTHGRRPELRPLPLRRLDAALVYTPLTPGGEEQLLPEGRFEATESGSAGSLWRERLYTLRLSDEEAQLFASALSQGQVALSVGYAFWADGARPDRPLAEVTGTPKLVAELERLGGLSGSDATEGAAAEGSGDGDGGTDEAQNSGPYLVHAGATGITLDPGRWPQLLQQVDLNSQAANAYGVLEIYCYDFASGRANDLFEKRVEIEARGVAGATVRREVVFRLDQPDVYAHTLRFPVAVRLDLPYRLRVRETLLDGEERLTLDWQERPSWTELVDVTRLAPVADGVIGATDEVETSEPAEPPETAETPETPETLELSGAYPGPEGATEPWLLRRNRMSDPTSLEVRDEMS